MSNPYHCIKLRNGETLFTEILGQDNSKSLSLNNPLVISSEEEHELALVPWAQYIEGSVVIIPLNEILFSEPLGKQFFEYYGRVVIQLEINRIKARLFQAMHEEPKFDMGVIIEGLHEMREVSDNLARKFGVPVPDFSEFEKIIQKHKSEIVLH